MKKRDKDDVYFNDILAILWVLGGLWGAHVGALEAPEGSKIHIQERLCERRDALAAVSGPKTPQKPPKGA